MKNRTFSIGGFAITMMALSGAAQAWGCPSKSVVHCRVPDQEVYAIFYQNICSPQSDMGMMAISSPDMPTGQVTVENVKVARDGSRITFTEVDYDALQLEVRIETAASGSEPGFGKGTLTVDVPGFSAKDLSLDCVVWE